MYNDKALHSLGSRRVKRSSVKYTAGSTFLWCTRCDFAAKTLSALEKHKKSSHVISFSGPSSSSTSLALPKHQSTRNNSVTEVLLQENITITDISKEGSNPGVENVLKYTCMECNFKTTSKSLMDEHVHSLHVSVQMDEVYFICGICNHKFLKADDYNIHLKEHDKQVELTTTPTAASNHVKETPSDAILLKTVNNISMINLEESVELAPEKASVLFKCDQCYFTFTEQLNLNAHIEMEHSKKTVFTKKIQPNSVKESEGKKSKVKINVEKPPSTCKDNTESEVVCPFCKLSSKNLMSLKIHIENIHTNPKAEKPIDIGEVITSIGNETFSKCPHCDFVGSKSDIEGHIAKKHGFVVICGECGNKFSDPKTCEDHIETFHRINIEEHEEVSCRKCAYKSKDINLIDIHMEEYYGGKKIVVEESEDIVVELTCRGCNYEGKSCDDIKQHKSKHVLLKCDQCDYIAGRDDELKQHKQTQHFTARVNLQNTLPTNKKSILMSCDQCDYSCKLRIQLRHHIIRAHQNRKYEEKKYTCTSCSFQTDFLIKIHI